MNLYEFTYGLPGSPAVRQCEAVRSAVCGSAHGSVCAVRVAVCGSALGSSVGHCARQCAAVRQYGSACQCAAVCGSVHSLRNFSVRDV